MHSVGKFYFVERCYFYLECDGAVLAPEQPRPTHFPVDNVDAWNEDTTSR